MKLLFSGLIILFTFSPCISQSCLDKIESAYIFFENQDYVSAVEVFKACEKECLFTQDDYYFYGASLSKTGHIEEAKYASLKAYKGLHTFAMMLADSLYSNLHNDVMKECSKHKELSSLIEKEKLIIDEFDFKKFDSIYKSKAISSLKARAILKVVDYLYRNQDTINGDFYVDQLFQHSSYSSLEIKKAFRSKFNISKNEILKSNFHHQVKNEDQFYNLLKALDTFINSKETNDVVKKVEIIEKHKLTIHLNANNCYNVACVYSLSGEFDKAFQFLRLALSKGYNNFSHLFKDKDLIPLLNSPTGQEVYKYCFLKTYGSLLNETIYTFDYSFRNGDKSKKLQYEYLESNGMFSIVPESLSIYDFNTDTVYVTTTTIGTSLFNIDPMKSTYSLDKNNQIRVNTDPENLWVLICKTTPNEKYMINAGYYSMMRVGNIDFLYKIMTNTLELNRILEIRKGRFRKLSKKAFDLYLPFADKKALPVSDFELEEAEIIKSIVGFIRESPKENLGPMFKAKVFNYRSPAFIDLFVDLLKGYNKNSNISDSETLEIADIYYDIYRSLPLYKIFGKKIERISEQDFKNYIIDRQADVIIESIVKWWEPYKKHGPEVKS